MVMLMLIVMVSGDDDADGEWYEEAFSGGGYQGEWCRGFYNHFLHLTLAYNQLQNNTLIVTMTINCISVTNRTHLGDNY